MLTYSIKRAHEVRKFHVAVVQQRLPKKCTKKCDCFFFANLNLLLFCCSPSPLQKLSVVVIQKFCYHGNVTSHFSSLLFALLLCAQTFITKFCSTLGQGRGEEGKKEFKSSSLPNTLTMSVALINKIWHQLNLTWWNENYMLVKVTINDSFFTEFQGPLR